MLLIFYCGFLVFYELFVALKKVKKHSTPTKQMELHESILSANMILGNCFNV